MKDNSERNEWACNKAHSDLIAKYGDGENILGYDEHGSVIYKTEEIQDEFNELYDKYWDDYFSIKFKEACVILNELGVAYSVWTLGEIENQVAQHPYYEWDRKLGQQVLNRIEKKYDSEIGITWDVVNYNIDQVFKQQIKTYVFKEEDFTQSQWKKFIYLHHPYFDPKLPHLIEIPHTDLLLNYEWFNIARIDTLETTNELDEAILEFIEEYSKDGDMSELTIQIKGDSNGDLGFIVYVFVKDTLTLIKTKAFWFEDYV